MGRLADLLSTELRLVSNLDKSIGRAQSCERRNDLFSSFHNFLNLASDK